MWLFFLAYILVLYIFFIFLPINLNEWVGYIWSERGTIAQIMVSYMLSFFSAILVVYIFRSSLEDGSELIIQSKPLKREKLILIKFLIFALYTVFFSLLTIVFMFAALFIPNSNKNIIFSVIATIAALTFIEIMFFGSMGTLLSLFFNKIVVFIGITTINILSIIYSIICMSIQKDPKAIIQNSKSQTSLSYNYWTKDWKVATIGQITSISTDINDLTKYFDIDEIKNYWNDIQNKSFVDPLLLFDIPEHFSYMGNLFLLKHAYDTKNSSSIGENKWYTYGIEKSLFEKNKLNINLNDDNYEWMNFVKKNIPYFLTNYSNLNISVLKDFFIKLNGGFKEWEHISSIENLTSLLVNGSSIQYNYQTEQMKEQWFKYSGIDNWTTSTDYAAGLIYNGSSLKNHKHILLSKQLEPTPFECKLFNYVLYKLLYTDDWFSDVMKKSTSTWSYNEQTYGNDDFQHAKCRKIDVILYDEIFKKYEKELNLKNEYDYGIEFLKLKYFLFHQLTGYYGTDDVETNDYSSEKSEQQIKVKWTEYFKFCFLPQFNCFTARNYENIDNSSSKKLSELFSYGFIPLPYLYDKNKAPSENAINFFIGKNHDDILSKFSPTYDGTMKPSNDLENYFVQFNINSDQKWQKLKRDDKNYSYGWFSEMGIRAQSLINWASNTNTNIPSYLGKPINKYVNYIFKTNISSPNFLYGSFIFTTKQKISNLFLYIIYLLISLITTSTSFNCYIRHDFS